MLNYTEDLNPCRNSSICKHGGTCISASGSSYNCECLSGYTGKDCSQG